MNSKQHNPNRKSPSEELVLLYRKYLANRTMFEKTLLGLIDSKQNADCLMPLYEEMVESAYACILQKDFCCKHAQFKSMNDNKQEFTIEELIQMVNETKI